jgi:chromosome segregation ATPase
MGKEMDSKQDINASLAALQRLRARRADLLEEITEIDKSLETIQREISEIFGESPAPNSSPSLPLRSGDKKSIRRDGEMTVNAAVLEVIAEAGTEISKSDIRIGAMRLAGPFSESALNSALMHWVDEKEIKNTARGYYAVVGGR